MLYVLYIKWCKYIIWFVKDEPKKEVRGLLPSCSCLISTSVNSYYNIIPTGSSMLNERSQFWVLTISISKPKILIQLNCFLKTDFYQFGQLPKLLLPTKMELFSLSDVHDYFHFCKKWQKPILSGSQHTQHNLYLRGNSTF